MAEVGFLGLGNMGSAMATRLVQAGHGQVGGVPGQHLRHARLSHPPRHLRGHRRFPAPLAHEDPADLGELLSETLN